MKAFVRVTAGDHLEDKLRCPLSVYRRGQACGKDILDWKMQVKLLYFERNTLWLQHRIVAFES